MLNTQTYFDICPNHLGFIGSKLNKSHAHKSLNILATLAKQISTGLLNNTLS